jgi:cysteinyl-tRNA synthetase
MLILDGMVRLFSTLSRAKDEVRPGDPDGRIRMYECGLTLSGEPHIGHARTAIVFDVLKRWLEYRGMPVIHVRNVTDVEDKIIRKAGELGVTCAEVVARFDPLVKELFRRLNLMPLAVEPYASRHIPEIVALIGTLVDKGLAYESGGDVYFSVRKFPSYGRLSGNTVDDLVAGARVATGELKRDPLDFDLWKAAKPGEPSWDSPWGPGRPGWHIECSAMSMKYLGETFDIHGGGNDLVFPHHENEIAQSTGATGKPFARIWVHPGWVTLNQEKMSKSLGNVLPLRAVLDRLPTPALRLLVCQTHYRSPFEWSDTAERQARETYDTLVRQLDPASQGGDGSVTSGAQEVGEISVARLAAFDTAMDDDLATPRALAEIFSLSAAVAHVVRGTGWTGDLMKIRAAILGRLAALGIEPEFGGGEIPSDLAALLTERGEARRRKDWKRSDEIRGIFLGRGWGIEDTPRGQTVRKS